MELRRYYKQQIRREFIEKFNLTNIHVTSVVQTIKLVYKSKKLFKSPYNSNFILRRLFLLESFSRTKWSVRPLYYPKPGRALVKSESFSIIFETQIPKTFIYDFILSLYLFIRMRNRRGKVLFKCFHNSISKKMTLVLNRVNLAPWIPSAMRHVSSINKMCIHFNVSNAILYKCLMIRLQLKKYIKYSRI